MVWFNKFSSPNHSLTKPQPYNLIGDGPEGPEVYVMTEKFKRRFPTNSVLTTCNPLNDRYKNGGKNAIPQGFLQDLPLKITSVTSKGKKTIVKFNKGWALLISYGMTGHWENTANQYAQIELKGIIPAKRKVNYYWTSKRSLPTCVVEFISHARLEVEVCQLGLDIIRDDPGPDEILAAYFKSKKNICAFLMDQNVFCGIGNYIKAVVLYRCGLSPYRRVHELNDGEKWLIWYHAKKLANEAIAAEGMGIRDYSDEDGNLVGVDFDITPYAMDYDNAGNEVIGETIAGRTTWWVPAVQF